MYSAIFPTLRNDTSYGINILFPTLPTYTDPAAVSEYDAATLRSIVFGIFMALATFHKIRQNGIKYICIVKGIQVVVLICCRSA